MNRVCHKVHNSTVNEAMAASLHVPSNLLGTDQATTCPCTIWTTDSFENSQYMN